MNPSGMRTAALTMLALAASGASLGNGQEYGSELQSKGIDEAQRRKGNRNQAKNKVAAKSRARNRRNK